MSKLEFYNEVFNLLASIGGAGEHWRDDFIYHHAREKNICTEYRFGGKLGFGGKYRSEKNTVDCYSENETPETLKIIRKLNKALAKLKEKYLDQMDDEPNAGIGDNE